MSALFNRPRRRSSWTLGLCVLIGMMVAPDSGMLQNSLRNLRFAGLPNATDANVTCLPPRHIGFDNWPAGHD